MEFPKIETLYQRDEKHNLTDELKMPVIKTISEWDVTEKIDGTNIRIILDIGGKMRIGGRTDSASIPADLIKVLYEMFNAEKMKEVFWLPGKEGVKQPVSAILYCEGYGAGIQKAGSGYRKDKSFRLFDVLVADRWWLDWPNTCDVAVKLGIKTVPYLGRWN